MAYKKDLEKPKGLKMLAVWGKDRSEREREVHEYWAIEPVPHCLASSVGRGEILEKTSPG